MKRLLLSFGMILPLIAAANNMSIHGTLVAPPCKISNGQTIEVTFGSNLGVNKIDGSNYKQPVNYIINCDSGYESHNLAIVVDTSNPAAFDASAVKTDKAGLGIHILVNGVPVTFSGRVAVDNPSLPPKIEAVPVHDPDVILTAGTFEATMTLRADYL